MGYNIHNNNNNKTDPNLIANEEQSTFVWVNGIKYALAKNLDASTSLNQYLRTTLNLTGTKITCGEGGCGACVVHVRRPVLDVVSNGHHNANFIEHSVNSCLVPILMCSNWHITTIEGIRSSSDDSSDNNNTSNNGGGGKPHVIQQRLSEYHGTQCGYCTPGMCMQQFSTLAQTNNDNTANKISEADIEDTFDGNICRCTGYRPILDAMKSFVNNNNDTEAIQHNSTVTSNNDCTSATELSAAWQQNCRFDSKWYAPTTLEQFWKFVAKQRSIGNIRIVAGNTSTGIYKPSPTAQHNIQYVDINRIHDLRTIRITGNDDGNIELGALVTLSEMIIIFKRHAAKHREFRYLNDIAEHLQRVANQSVRNVATWSGNLALKRAHPEFPSDLAVCLEAAQAELHIQTGENEIIVISSISEYLLQRQDKIFLLTRLILKPLPNDTAVYASFKISPRERNSHAYVNAAMLFPSVSQSGVLLDPPVIIYGGFEYGLIRAHAVEKVLSHNFDLRVWNKNCDVVFAALDKDLSSSSSANHQQKNIRTVCSIGKDAAQHKLFKLMLARNLLYKALLKCVETAATDINLDPRLRGAWQRIARPVSSGKQSFEGQGQKSDYPLTQPVVKLESMLQTTGRAVYISDMNSPLNLLHAAPILAPAGPARILKFDTTLAFAAFPKARVLTAADIPGQNNFMPPPFMPEPLFSCNNTMEFAGQTVGMIVADSEADARRAAQLVRIEYEMLQTPVLTIDDAIVQNSYSNISDDVLVGLPWLGLKDVRVGGDVEAALAASAHVVEGEVRQDAQFHFAMETHVTLATPQDDGDSYLLHSGTQWLALTAAGVAQVLGITTNRIDIQVPRLGGGFGAKQSRAGQTAAMAALAACVLRKPVKLHMSLQDQMRMFGTRHAFLGRYRAGFGRDGVLQAVELKLYYNVGISANDFVGVAARYGTFAIKCPVWFVRQQLCHTHLPTSTVMRGPGFIEIENTIQTILEHGAFALKTIDAMEVRRRNLVQNGDVTYGGLLIQQCAAEQILQQLLKESDFERRKHVEIVEFNRQHRWRKRALSGAVMRYEINYDAWRFTALVDVLYHDGSVCISHGGVEMGQGINTKAAQTCAYEFGIALDRIKVKNCHTFTSANVMATAASVTSEMVCAAVEQSCRKIKARMLDRKIQKKQQNGEVVDDNDWLSLVRICAENSVDLSERTWISGSTIPREKIGYSIYGAASVEVELDVLTGERQVRRLDIVYDVGQSQSPQIDMGQAEGALVQGLGAYLGEHYIRDIETGSLLTDSTWHYKVPSALDIPVDMRISFMKNPTRNMQGVQRSKSVGEPPIVLSACVISALRSAVLGARKELGEEDRWVTLDAPATPEALLMCTEVKSSHLDISELPRQNSQNNELCNGHA